MARVGLDRSLRVLDTELILLGGIVESAILRSIDALMKSDLDLAQQVRKEDDLVDEKQREIDAFCVDVIRREAPLAGDLRSLLAAIKIAYELERVGDYANGIAKIVIRMNREPPIKRLVDIPKMTEISVSMLKQSMELYQRHRDIDKVEVQALTDKILEADNQVDKLYERVVVDLIKVMQDDPDKVIRGTYLLWIAHLIERIADRAENIGGMAQYQITGRHLRKHEN